LLRLIKVISDFPGLGLKLNRPGEFAVRRTALEDYPRREQRGLRERGEQVRRLNLFLALFVAGVLFAYHPHHAFAADYFATLADALH
jgi:hypothetical protein